MSNTNKTAQAGTFAKYWVNETPNVISNENNEIRVYAQHGKVQVYPKVAKAERGIGKGATINFDTFTKAELTTFKTLLTDLYDSGAEGFEENKRYWLEETATVLTTDKNELRFYPEHGKLQIFPRVAKLDGSVGVGKGATINFTNLDFTKEVDAIYTALVSVAKTFLEAPEMPKQESPKAQETPAVSASAPTAPQAPQATTPIPVDELIQRVMEQVTPAIAAQIQSLINAAQVGKETPVTEAPAETVEKTEPAPLKLGGEMVEAPLKTSATEDDEETFTEPETDEDETVETAVETQVEAAETEVEAVETPVEPVETKVEAVETAVEAPAVTDIKQVKGLSEKDLRAQFKKQSDINLNEYNPTLAIALFEEMKKRKFM